MSPASRSRGIPRRSQPIPRRSTTPLVIGGLIAIVVVAALAAVIIAGGPPRGAPEPAARVTISGEPLPPLTDLAVDAAVGGPVPTLSSTDLSGRPMTIGPGNGPMAIVVLAHWCPHCQAELPAIVQFILQGDVPDGVSVVGLSTGIDAVRPNYPPSAWFEREGWTQPTLIDDAESSALDALGLRSFPGLVLVDAQGIVVQRLTGKIGAAEFGEMLGSLVE